MYMRFSVQVHGVVVKLNRPMAYAHRTIKLNTFTERFVRHYLRAGRIQFKLRIGKIPFE